MSHSFDQTTVRRRRNSSSQAETGSKSNSIDADKPTGTGSTTQSLLADIADDIETSQAELNESLVDENDKIYRTLHRTENLFHDIVEVFASTLTVLFAMQLHHGLPMVIFSTLWRVQVQNSNSTVVDSSIFYMTAAEIVVPMAVSYLLPPTHFTCSRKVMQVGS